MTTTPQEHIEHALGGSLVPGKTYPHPLSAQIEPWYCYTVDGGHSICVIIMSQVKPGEPLEDFLVPAPVKTVLRAGVAKRNGFLWCDLPYDDTRGLVVPEGDNEY
jgi:hypothetical protein